MNEEIITRKVKTILSALLRLDPEEIEPECDLAADLGADSLELSEFILALEEEFEIHIPHEDVEDIQTVQDAISWLVNNVDD